jgi:outer membrane protein OmpA-like peptidoglycan-associated protein
MKKNILTLSVVALGMLSISAFAAVKSVSMEKLSANVNVSSTTGSVRNGNKLPQITWTEDQRLLLANGNNIKTQNGSIFNEFGLDYQMELMDSVISQSKNYISGNSPYFRGTMSQVVQLNDLVYDNPDLRPVVLNQLSWSAGGDTLVVKSGINDIKDLKGKRIAVMAYGPHVYFMWRTLKSAGLSFSDVEIVWVRDLTGTDQTPSSAFYDKSIHAAFMIAPDASYLTVGDNAVSGAKILFTTKQASKFIADVYAVRSDFYNANKDVLQKFVHAQFVAKEKADDVFKNRKSSEFKKWMKVSAEHLLGSADLLEDAEGMFEFDANHAGFAENVEFFTNARNGRNFERLTDEINDALLDMNLVSQKRTLTKADWDWSSFKSGLKHANAVAVPAFNRSQVAKVVKQMQANDTLDGEQFLTEEIKFKAGQSTFVFNKQLHGAIFDKVVDEASAYANTLIIIEAHSDPAYYLINKYKKKLPVKTLKRIRQAGWDLSVKRAKEVREALITYARDVKQVDLDVSQFEFVGYGIDKPLTGICGTEPCKIALKGLAAKNAYAANRRAVIGFTRIEAEIEASADDFDF